MRVKKGSNRFLRDASNFVNHDGTSRATKSESFLPCCLPEAGTLSSAKVHSLHAPFPLYICSWAPLEAGVGAGSGAGRCSGLMRVTNLAPPSSTDASGSHSFRNATFLLMPSHIPTDDRQRSPPSPTCRMPDRHIDMTMAYHKTRRASQHLSFHPSLVSCCKNPPWQHATI